MNFEENIIAEFVAKPRTGEEIKELFPEFAEYHKLDDDTLYKLN